MSCLRKLFCTMIHIETDNFDLVDMIANLTDWPVFSSDLVSFQILQDGFRISALPTYLGIEICVQILSPRKREVAVFFRT
ncbi:hypothetical protein Bca4012_068275 [Brassica carinata]